MTFDTATFLAGLFDPVPVSERDAGGTLPAVESLPLPRDVIEFANHGLPTRAREQRHDAEVNDGPAKRRLIGNGFPPRTSPKPPVLILATPPVLCVYCERRPVMPELRGMTSGRCYMCWSTSLGPLT